MDFRNNRQGGRGGDRGGFQRRSFGPRQMHKATCSGCGQECEVPFKPVEGREVFCRDCFMKRKEGGAPTSNTKPKSTEEESEEDEE